MYEALIRYLNAQTENDPDDISVVKVAPTGKAAFNIRGNTLHSAFKISANRGFNYCTLDRDRLNTIRAQLQRMQVVFIDEISMVGCGMFNFRGGSRLVPLVSGNWSNFAKLCVLCLIVNYKSLIKSLAISPI